jgi:broad-specificity NMP kinase
MHRVIVVTGTPGTGKTALAAGLGRAIRGSTVIDANAIVKSEGLFSGYDEYGTMIADLDKLAKRINSLASKTRGTVIIEGHLMCDIRVRGAAAIVLRCHIKELEGRLGKRGYEGSKLHDNLVSEALDYCGARASANYKRVFEIIGSRKKMLSDAMAIIKGRSKGQRIELSEELLDIMDRVAK